ncbi:MAG: tetratricopeptide repeat protein [Desulfarculaceae bacterium]|nr:tetratricopeptide repeat protein [Desulfarculaceae bacterium]MCF8071330.1 tetratricopeptide repeat protein [Desulfarculaceae bacterium]MCF8101655.1 tetratricopeptide repeat protein [Desulfarculaceae bacterium]MCF8116736.1 tetratricopeptide repeat protein [Desulfarculaceae bacterium]
MPSKKLIMTLLVGLAAAGLMLATGCATSDQSGARWLQRGEAEQLLAAQAARAEVDPDPDKVPIEPSAMEAQGDVMASQGAPWNAMNQYRLALRGAKGKAKMRLEGKIAGLDLRVGRYELARDGFAKLTKTYPKQAVFWQGLGLAQVALHDLPRAEKSLTQAARLDPSLWRAQNLLGVIYNRNRQPKQAAAAFRAALISKPGNPALYNNLALSQMMLGDYQGAEASLRRALALNPEHRKAANNLGLLLMRQGRNQEAFQTFATAEGVAQAHNNMGVLLAWQGQPNQAQRQFKAALQALPRYYPLAARHLDQMAERPESPVNRMSSRPMVPLASQKPAAKANRPKAVAKPKAPKPARRSVAKAPAKPKPKAKKAPPKQAKLSPKPSAPKAKPKVEGAKPAPQAKPAPLSKEQRMALDKARAEAEAKAKAAAEAKARAEAKAQAEAAAKAAAEKAAQEAEAKAKPAPSKEQGMMELKPSPSLANASAPAPAAAAGQTRVAKGLWIQPDGTLAYGEAAPGPQSYGVVFGTPPRD